MKRLALVLIVFGLLGALPILAAENCDMNNDTEGGASQCDLKNKSVENKIERKEEVINIGSHKYRAAALKELEDSLKEDNSILDELSKL